MPRTAWERTLERWLDDAPAGGRRIEIVSIARVPVIGAIEDGHVRTSVVLRDVATGLLDGLELLAGKLDRNEV